jgi:hypothetical protein
MLQPLKTSTMIRITNERERPEVISYMTTRRAIGMLGMMLPVVLLTAGAILGYKNMMPSISHYYYTYMVTIFTGTLCAVGLFLFTYKGFGKLDDIATNFAGLCAFGIALFPTDDLPAGLKHYSIYRDGLGFPNDAIHYTFAACFFVTLALISLFLFTQTKKGEVPTHEKVVRNRVYRTCGVLMLLFCALIPVASKITALHGANATFWLEMGSLWAFGFSWLTKGELVKADKTKLRHDEHSILPAGQKEMAN